MAQPGATDPSSPKEWIYTLYPVLYRSSKQQKKPFSQSKADWSVLVAEPNWVGRFLDALVVSCSEHMFSRQL